MRTATPHPLELALSVNGNPLPPVKIRAADRWQEIPIAVPREHVAASMDVVLGAVSGEHIAYHLWGLQK